MIKEEVAINKTSKEKDISNILQMVEIEFIYKLCYMNKKDLITLKEIFTTIFDIAIDTVTTINEWVRMSSVTYKVKSICIYLVC